MTAPARRAAFRVLRDVHRTHTDLAHAQSRARLKLPDPRDRALAMDIATGTLRWRACLDHEIARTASRRLEQIEPAVLDILRLGLYQLRHLQRVPHHAAIHDAVELVREAGKPGAASFVNAVLRTLARTSVGLPPKPTARGEITPTDWDAAIAYLGVTQSHPRWLVERWLDRHGLDATDQWTRFNNAIAPIAIRVNTRRISTEQLVVDLAAEDIAVRPGQWSTRTLITTQGNPLTSGLANQGLFWAQDEASQLVAELIAVKPGEHVLDVCAAPGGKSLIATERMGDRGMLVAGDRRANRTRVLKQRLEEAGTSCARVVQLDGQHPPLRPVFDWVVVDAPCSGLGTLRRDPDIKWRREERDLGALAAQQARLLDGASVVVRPGGRLLYATCSSEPEENDRVVESFLRAHAQFQQDPPDSPNLEPFVEPNGTFRTLPFRDGLEGFFAAILRRTSDSAL